MELWNCGILELWNCRKGGKERGRGGRGGREGKRDGWNCGNVTE